MKRKAATTASAILFAACMLIIGMLNLRFPTYGGDFWRTATSVYPGLHDLRTIGHVILGTIYGAMAGAILGYVFSSLYRWAGGLGIPETRRASTTTTDPLMRRAS